MTEPETPPYPAWPTKVWAPYPDLRIRVTQKGQGQYAMEIWRAAADGAYDYTVIRDLASIQVSVSKLGLDHEDSKFRSETCPPS